MYELTMAEVDFVSGAANDGPSSQFVATAKRPGGSQREINVSIEGGANQQQGAFFMGRISMTIRN